MNQKRIKRARFLTVFRADKQRGEKTTAKRMGGWIKYIDVNSLIS